MNKYGFKIVATCALPRQICKFQRESKRQIFAKIVITRKKKRMFKPIFSFNLTNKTEKDCFNLYDYTILALN